MKALTRSLVVFFFGLVLAAPALRADVQWRSPLTLGEPTEIPGQVLPPGKYVVKVLDAQNPRKVVQFMNEDETQVVATVMGVPNYRVTAGEGQFVYFQRAEGHPQALKYWFYPANNFGIEFVYPKAEAIQIAEASKQEVYAAPSAKPEAQEPVVAVAPNAKERPVKVEAAPPPPAPAPKTAEAPAPAPAPAAPSSTEPAKPAKRKKLPKTGTDEPLLFLAGLGALGAGVTLRVLGRRG